MKKTLFLAAALLAFFVRADYIYWMVDNPAGDSGQYTWTTAYLVQSNVSEDSGRIGTLTSASAASLSALDEYAYSTLGANYDQASFFIELYNDSTFLAQSETRTYAQVKDSIFGGNPMSPIAAGTSAFAPASSTYNVPEPTSGLLFLVGGMLLGLRRRRQG
ncbi:MAG: PEP-CTERM sorting domain-containing protein [Kiritimatiellae bacterium]|nr:PEP-CTERM sorting domain-containing protein [Kiritimatiellia bacterium]